MFTLQGEEHPYRALIQMQEGAATLTPEGVVHYCNGCFAESLELPLDGSWAAGWRSSSRRRTAHCYPRCSVRVGAGRSLVFRHDATEVPVMVSAISLRGDAPAAVCLVVSDLTERKRHEEELYDFMRRWNRRSFGARRNLQRRIENWRPKSRSGSRPRRRCARAKSGSGP